MFDPVLEAIRKSTEVNMRMQQELMHRWIAEWFGASLQSAASAGIASFRAFEKQWTEMVKDMIRQQHKSMEEQFRAGMKQLEEAFRLAEGAELDEVRSQCMELWRKSFRYLSEAQEAQLRQMQTAMSKWSELVSKNVS